MDRTGIPDIDIEHAKYSDFMPVTNGKAAHCQPMSGNKTEVQGTEYKVPPKQGSSLSYPVFCQV